MINHGVIASVGDDTGASGGAIDYGDAVAVADFLNGFYSIDGVEVTLASIVDRPDLVTGSGLAIDWNVEDVCYPIGDLLAKLSLAEFTIVFEMFEHEETEGSATSIMYAENSADPPDRNWFITDGDSGASISSDEVDGITGQRFASASAGISKPAIRKIAATRTSDHVAISANGSAVGTDFAESWSSGARAMDTIGAFCTPIGDTFPDNRGFLRHVIVYPIKLDADLPTYSTIV